MRYFLKKPYHRFFYYLLIRGWVMMALNLTAPRAAHAAPLSVTSALDDGSAGTLRAVIAAAAPGDTISFAPSVTGTITLTQGQLVINKSLTINGPGASTLTIDGAGNSRIFSVTVGPVAISGLSLRNGLVTDKGGAILNAAGLTLANLDLEFNRVHNSPNQVGTNGQGGAIFNESTGTLTIQSSTLGNNNVQVEGTIVAGGAIASYGALFVATSAFFYNDAYHFNTITVCTVCVGGAIANFGSLSITTSYFNLNAINLVYIGDGNVRGGAVYNGGSGTISSSTFDNNAAYAYGIGPGKIVGGGAVADGGTQLLMLNDTMIRNIATVGSCGGTTNCALGGAIYARATTTLLSSTITGNYVNSPQPLTTSLGTGLYSGDNTGPIMRSTIIADNQEIMGYTSGGQIGGVIRSQGYNLISDSSGSGLVATDQRSIEPLLYNLTLSLPGTTRTEALRTGSPAYGKGNCTLSPAVSTDQRGATRKAICDVGAYEQPKRVQPQTIGIFDSGVFYLRNSNSRGAPDIQTIFGAPSMLAVTGDWNADGVDSIGVYDPATGVFYLSNSNTTPAVDYQFVLGDPGDTPLAGKWDNTMSGVGAGVFRPSNGLIYLRRTLSTGVADYTMVLGRPEM